MLVLQDNRKTSDRGFMTDNATTSRGFCVLTHCNVKRLHVEQGVSPSHLILRRRHLSHAFDTDFLLGCQSLTAVGEKRLGPSPAGRDAAYLSVGGLLKYFENVLKGHIVGLGSQGFRAGW
jgi:hypothetical protein